IPNDHYSSLSCHSDRSESFFSIRVIEVRVSSRQLSPKTVLASSKETPCRRMFEAAFSGSHSNRTGRGAHAEPYALNPMRRVYSEDLSISWLPGRATFSYLQHCSQ